MRLGRPKEAVPPGTFDGEDGTSLRTFLDRYERYFSLKYEGNDHDRAVGLANFLRGTALGAYKAMSGSQIKYSRLKPLLLDWYKSERTSVRQQKLDDFANAKYQSSDSFRLYCLRLEQLAEKAFPGNLAERERQLRKKFRETVPPFFLNKLENAQSAVSAMGDGKLTWQRMKKVAETEDVLRKEKNSRKGNGEKLNTSVWFNSSKPVVESSRNSTQEGRTRGITPVNSRGRGPQTYGRGVGNTYGRTERKSPLNEKQAFQYCAWCGKMGHTERFCWLKKGACISCGSQDHVREHCPTPASRRSTMRLQCSVCDGDHLGKDCSTSQRLSALLNPNAPSQ